MLGRRIMRPWQLSQLYLRSTVSSITVRRCNLSQQQRLSSTIASDSPHASIDGKEEGVLPKQDGESGDISNHDTQKQSRPEKTEPDLPYGPPGIKDKPIVQVDSLHLAPAQQLGRLLDDLMPATSGGAPYLLGKSVPQGSHLVYFPIKDTPSALAPDGAESCHVPANFDLTKPGAMRVWVGGTLAFRSNWTKKLRFFDPSKGRERYFYWSCFERFGSMKQTHHKGETRAVVELKRFYVGAKGPRAEEQSEEAHVESSGWSIRETRMLAFLPSFNTDSSAKFPAPGVPTVSYKFTPTPEHLFQFSALTNNAHYIHLDREKGLVHGPLTLAIMVRAVIHATFDPAVFRTDLADLTYRNLRPLYVGQEATVCLRPKPETEVDSAQASTRENENTQYDQWYVWIEGPDGSMAVRATAQIRRILKPLPPKPGNPQHIKHAKTKYTKAKSVETESEAKPVGTESTEAKSAETESEAKADDTESEARPAEPVNRGPTI